MNGKTKHRLNQARKALKLTGSKRRSLHFKSVVGQHPVNHQAVRTITLNVDDPVPPRRPNKQPSKQSD